MTSLQVNALNFNNKISIDFNGGNLSSDTGLLAYRSFDEKIGFSRLLKNTFADFEASKTGHTYKNSDVILQNVFKFIAGYHTDDASDELATDPVFKKLLNVDKLASQPTVSRRCNELNIETYKLMERINTELLTRAYSVKRPKHIIFDIDSTEVQTYGKQYGSSFNHHYNSTGFHPLLLFDGITGDLIKAELRSGNVYTSRNVVAFMGPIIKHYNTHYKDVYTVIRGDSGFAKPELYELAEEHNIPYAIRLKANATLAKYINEFMLDFHFEFGSDYSKTHTQYGEFMYAAKSWATERRVCFKIQRKAGELLPSTTFVVTTMEASPRDVIKFYSKRGNMENFIKEAKLDFGMDTLSHTSYLANANRMMQMVLAYTLNNLMRRLCFPKHETSKRMHSLRTILVKVASRFISSGRYFKFKLCSSYPYKSFFTNLFERIDMLPVL